MLKGRIVDVVLVLALCASVVRLSSRRGSHDPQDGQVVEARARHLHDLATASQKAATSASRSAPGAEPWRFFAAVSFTRSRPHRDAEPSPSRPRRSRAVARVHSRAWPRDLDRCPGACAGLCAGRSPIARGGCRGSATSPAPCTPLVLTLSDVVAPLETEPRGEPTFRLPLVQVGDRLASLGRSSPRFTVSARIHSGTVFSRSQSTSAARASLKFFSRMLRARRPCGIRRGQPRARWRLHRPW